MGKAIARGSKKALIDRCYADPESRPIILKKIGRVIKEEIKKMCSENTGSILRSGTYADIRFQVGNFTPGDETTCTCTYGHPLLMYCNQASKK